MNQRQSIPPPKDKLLFTPGPLTTSATVKQAMLRDLGSRDAEFITTVQELRHELLAVAGVSQRDGWEAVPLQGSGTYAVEAALTCAVPPEGGKWLLLVNGAYGERMAKICQVHRIPHTALKFGEDTQVDVAQAEAALQADPAITAVAIVHCETTTGIMNPVEAIGPAVKRHGRTFLVDSMSAFGAVEFDMNASGADFLVSSANKCIEGVPGFSFALCRRAALLATKGWSRTLVLDLCEQWEALEKTGQFRFTPPTHTILAFRQALRELAQEGGVAGRAARYRRNHQVVLRGMREMGFKEYLNPEVQGHIITSFRYPADPNFHFETFYSKLNDKGHVIYPGKLSNADCFRIGNIGRIFEGDVKALVGAIGETLAEMQVKLR